jgi:monothiol glutaredoxin
VEVDLAAKGRKIDFYPAGEISTIWISEQEKFMEIEATIKDQIGSNPILIYMKGSPDQPQCGFSAQSCQALMGCGEKFAYIDILSNPDIRSTLPSISEWPTFPQLFIDGELVGGCDIITEMYESGELQPMIKEAAEKAEQAAS